ncbi:hypothetical protein L228DRAFT_283050 [Xylona heveae TC161]|uniref:Uncharacterized protein n=1 Tax=Xylona heveae (strain CBS 132557 / TC161) TaxID=1328760 RepID=A0A165H4X7_XYLHT|nr:hypothetical protein L228DRAFT_283050 [Xylona heveae TC161]KZF22988.1 hypothetical protein L228DRAFT_283050 [Xylona heveae TC161]
MVSENLGMEVIRQVLDHQPTTTTTYQPRILARGEASAELQRQFENEDWGDEAGTDEAQAAPEPRKMPEAYIVGEYKCAFENSYQADVYVHLLAAVMLGENGEAESSVPEGEPGHRLDEGGLSSASQSSESEAPHRAQEVTVHGAGDIALDWQTFHAAERTAQGQTIRMRVYSELQNIGLKICPSKARPNEQDRRKMTLTADWMTQRQRR